MMKTKWIRRVWGGQPQDAVAQLKQLAVETGSEVGLHALPLEEALAMLAAEIRQLSDEQHGLAGSEEHYREELSRLEEQRHRVQDEIESCCLEQGGSSRSQPSGGSPWRAVLNVALAFVLVGLALEAMELVVWRGWLALGLIALFLALNLESIAVQAQRIGRFIAHQRRGFQSRRLNKRISCLQVKLDRERERNRVREDSIYRMEEDALAHFFYHRLRAERAKEYKKAVAA